MKTPTLEELVKTMKKKGYLVYTEPFKLNLVGVRNSNPVDQNKFDDNIAFFYYDDKGKLNGKVAVGTTDPSTFYLKNPMNQSGAAILKGGQYVDAYTIGTHAGKYTALVQRLQPVAVIRDNDRDGYTNFFSGEQTGFFGINIHRASRGKNNVAIINKDSAGCQVFQNEADFNDMMRLAEVSSRKYGNKFTYTLIDDRDYIRYRNTWVVIALTGGLAVYVAYLISKKFK